MKVRQHGQNLWQLTRLWAFNCYPVREEEGLTLIDTNMSGSADGILGAAQTIGRPITRIALTHAHADHAGSLDELAAKLPDAEVLMVARTVEFLRGEPALLANEPQAKIRGGFVQATTQPTRLLQAGDLVGSLRVVAAPGHSPDQIAFYDERDGALIAGDALQTQGGIAVAGITRWRFPFPGMASWHLPTALHTAEALCDLNPSRLAVGHGPVLENPVAQMEGAVQEARKRNTGRQENQLKEVGRVYDEAQTVES